MRKIIAGINMTLDGYCDHTLIDADDEIHNYYTDFLDQAGTLLYGRITYQLMESFWPSVVENPTGIEAMDRFAHSIDNIEKIVFSRTLKQVTWKNSVLKHELQPEEMNQLKNEGTSNILVGSPGLIISMLNMNLVDELQLCVHPVLAGGGKVLFKDINPMTHLELLSTKRFGNGAMALTYRPEKKQGE